MRWLAQAKDQTSAVLTASGGIEVPNGSRRKVVVPQKRRTTGNAMSRFVSRNGIDNLASYSYSGKDLSLLVKYIFAPYYWNPLTEHLPRWLAPNLITLAGGVFMVLAMVGFVLLYAPPDSIPLSLAIFTALMIFLYQTADNLDGKQARRTHSSSALGELFDHGVDSIMIGIFSVVILACFQNSDVTIASVSLILMIIFYLSHWEEYHVGVLVLGYIMNPTELQVATILSLLITSLFPALGRVSILGLPINTYCTLVILVGAFIGIVKYFLNVAHTLHKHHSGSLLPAVLELVPFGVFFLASEALVLCLNGPLLAEWFYLVEGVFIVANAYLTQRLVVERICKEPIHKLDLFLVVYVLYAIVACALCFVLPDAVMPLTVAMLLVSVVVETYFVFDVISAFKTFLGINVFTIQH